MKMKPPTGPKKQTQFKPNFCQNLLCCNSFGFRLLSFSADRAFALEIVMVYSLADKRFEVLPPEFPRLRNYPENLSLLDCRHKSGVLLISREYNPDDVGIVFSDGSKEFESGHLRHAHIGYDYMHFFSLEDFKRFIAALDEKFIV